MRKRIRRDFNPAYHSYHGIKGIPFISPYAPIYLGDGIYFDSGCPGHVILGEPEGSESEKDLEREKNS